MRNAKTILPFFLILQGTACDPIGWSPEELADGRTSQPLRQLELGRDVYGSYCVGCHGEQGDGQGPAARFLEPKPRDFRLGRLKFGSVASGEAPRDEDYLWIVSQGLSGTAMPSFALLPEQERTAVVAYIKSFYKNWVEDPPGGAISLGKDPWSDDVPGGLEEGKKVYHALAKCWSCHPAYESRAEITRHNAESELPEPDFRPNMYQSEIKESQWGAPILPPDFLTDRLKNGVGLEAIVRVISSGVGGTAMPTWAGTLEPEQLWGLAYYIQSLVVLRGTREARALRDTLAAQPVPAPAAIPAP